MRLDKKDTSAVGMANFKLLKKKLKTLCRIMTGKNGFINPLNKGKYNKWLAKQLEEKTEEILEYRPLFSVLIPVYNVRGEYLKQCIDSVLNQSYKNFEICIVDDCSTKQDTLNSLKQYDGDARIKIKHRKTNGKISAATNDALEMALGEYIVLMDNDDVLVENALYEVARVLNKDKKIGFIYSDEDKLGVDGKRCDPHFKPDYSPDTLFSMNYICHLAVIRTDLMRKIGGFRGEYNGAQDYDLFLRVLEETDKVYHIPKILYHWRMSEGSTAMNLENKDYAEDAGKKAIKDAIKRRGINATVEQDDVSKYYSVKYLLKKQPLVSIMIPTKDHADILEKCLGSIYKKTTYGNYEIIVINNNSKEPETFELFEKYKKVHKNFCVMDANIEFNYSKLNNMAAKKAKGEVLVLLNNDTEVITPEWLDVLVGYAVQAHIGAVGPKLLYPDDTVQHAGVIMGLGGVASHAYLGEGRDAVGAYGRLRVPYNYAAVTGACLVVEKKKFEQVGGLEEDLKVAYNDIDFCMKLLKAGYYNVEVPMVELYHHESKTRGLDTAPEDKKRFDSEQDYMYKKWPEMIKQDKFYNPNYSKRMWFLLDKEK